MKKMIGCILLLFMAGTLFSQSVDVNVLQPDAAYDNVTNKKLYSDSTVTTFVIWIKHDVKLHKHAAHTEQVMILEGAATMTLGEKTFDVKAGDMIFIPAGTPHSVHVTSEVPLKVISIQAPIFDGTDRIMLEN